MKMILSSQIFGNLEATEKIHQFLGKSFEQLRVLLVSTPCLPYGPEKYYDELLMNGFKEENIIVFEHKNMQEYKDLAIDLIYVTGGNTFTGLKLIKESKFDKEIKKYLNNGVIYIGRSAGAHLVTKNIEHVLSFDSNEIGLSDYNGLGLFDGILVCHYSEKRTEIYEKLKKENKYKVYSLTNQEILVVEDNIINKY